MSAKYIYFECVTSITALTRPWAGAGVLGGRGIDSIRLASLPGQIHRTTNVVVSNCRITHQRATEVSKRATSQIYKALFMLANYRTAWTVEPFIYSLMYHCMQMSLTCVLHHSNGVFYRSLEVSVIDMRLIL